jgi:TRAP-type C4-dicarboxylate transport system permease large subunit
MAGMRSGKAAFSPARAMVPQEACGPRGEPARRARTLISIIRQSAITAAGSRPPMNIAPIETLVIEPTISIAMLGGMGNSTVIFMLGSIVLLIVVGVLLEGLPSLNVVAPLLIPIAGKLGLSELHYSLVLIIAMGIGGFMPLAGVGFYVCCAIMRCDIERASRAALPYMIMILVGLLVVAFVPWFALALPKYFGFRVQ